MLITVYEKKSTRISNYIEKYFMKRDKPLYRHYHDYTEVCLFTDSLRISSELTTTQKETQCDFSTRYVCLCQLHSTRQQS